MQKKLPKFTPEYIKTNLLFEEYSFIKACQQAARKARVEDELERPALAREMGMFKQGTVDEPNPNSIDYLFTTDEHGAPRRVMTVQNAVTLIRVSEDPGPLQIINRACGYIGIPLPDSGQLNGDLTDEMAQICEQSGTLIRNSNDMKDPEALKRLEKTFLELQGVAARGLGEVKQAQSILQD